MAKGMRLFCLALSVSWFLPPAALGADLTFTGNLRFVTATFLTVRLADGRVIDMRLRKTGPLAAPALVAQFKLADAVQISCKKIQADLDRTVDQYHSLQLTQIRFLRAPTPEEVARVNASLSWQNGDNLLKPSAVAPPKPKPAFQAPGGFERIRQVNLARIAQMPSFLADEAATRSRKPKGSDKWRPADTFESEMVFRGENATRQHVRINGKPWSSPSAWLPGPNWSIGFGTDLRPLFERNCDNEFTFQGHQEMQSRPVLAYVFRAPMDGCFGPGTTWYTQYAAEETGRMLVDAEGNVIQIERHEVGVPADLGGGSSVVLTWGDVKIGDAVHLLPVAEDWVWHAPNGDTWHVAVQYRNHRHFEAATTVHFEQDQAPTK